MNNLVGTKNAGYTIIKQGKIAVIAKMETPYGDQYVAWHYKTETNGKTDYFWGRYGDLEYVTECYNKKENGIYSGD